MQYSASHVATTALVLSQMASEAISEYQISNFPRGAFPQTWVVLHAYACIYTHLTSMYNPPSKIPGYGPERPDFYCDLT